MLHALGVVTSQKHGKQCGKAIGLDMVVGPGGRLFIIRLLISLPPHPTPRLTAPRIETRSAVNHPGRGFIGLI